ncbi:mannosyltransferase YkcB-related protein, partial [Nocardia gipuzkoensis]
LAAATTLALTVATAWLLLSRTATFLPWLRWAILFAGIVTTIALLLPAPPRAAAATALAATVIAIVGPLSYTINTLTVSHAGPIPTAGPQTQNRFGLGMPPGPNGQGPGGRPNPGGQPGPDSYGQQWIPGGPTASEGQGTGGQPDSRRRGGPGGFMTGERPSAQVVRALEEDEGSYTWVAATVSAMGAAPYQLATQRPVMPIGGFSGQDPAPSLERFQKLVAEGR